MNYKFYKWLYLYAEKQLKQLHMEEKRVDIKCTNCNTWYSISGIKHKHESVALDFGCKTTCGQCKNETYWNTIAAPVALECDNRGNPTND